MIDIIRDFNKEKDILKGIINYFRAKKDNCLLLTAYYILLQTYSKNEEIVKIKTELQKD